LNYYENKLYPLQDQVLNIVSLLKTDFYLTGGTVVNRVFNGQRYSDDLDFFLNGSSDFARQTQICFDALRENFPDMRPSITYDSFARFFLSTGEIPLKIEFVNDVPYRYGIPKESGLFIRTDNIRNILSNKICALSRDEAKDLADIWHICSILTFDWREIIEEAKRKDMWVDESDVAVIIGAFDVSRFHGVKWKDPFDDHAAKKHLDRISRDILAGKDNSLCASVQSRK
jgi:hypothetical protein